MMDENDVNTTFGFWLLQNVIEIPGGVTTTEALRNKSSFSNSKVIGLYISKLFPEVKKSSVCVDGKQLPCYKNITIPSILDTKDISFSEISNFMPTDTWFIYNKTTDLLNFAHFINVRFNGRQPLLELRIEANGNVNLYLDKEELDSETVGIPKKIESFTISIIKTLFKCHKLVRTCNGFEIKSKNEASFATSRNCTKELCQLNLASSIFTVLRHTTCKKIVAVTSYGSTSPCCLKFIQSRRYLNSKNKENEHNYTFEEIIEKIKVMAPDLTFNQITLIKSQIQASKTPKKGMRWDKDMICMAVTLFNRNPGSYRELVNNNWLNLPSESLIKRYKNAVHQEPGIVHDMMSWMCNEANSQGISTVGYYGGIILDEMSIQEDLQIVRCQGQTNLVGLSDSGQEAKHMQTLITEKSDYELANHVLQYIFSGLTGFRWPFANFPNTQAPPAELFVTFWKCVEALNSWGFKAIYCSVDGSANNRAFIKMHFDGDCTFHNMCVKYYKNPLHKIIFMMDPSHLLKKIRNSVLSSGFLDSHQRLLTLNSRFIIWKMWIDAYNWDLTNSIRVNHKLTDEHVFPTNAQKMRNKLAFQTLDSEMLNLMESYRKTLNEAGQMEMTSVIEFLKYTSFLVAFFGDARPIKDIQDTRLIEFRECYNFFKAWENEHLGDGDKGRRHKSLITMETREDLDFCFLGFMSRVELCLTELKTELIPCRINSDIIENIFCQQRSLYHGANTNPNYNQYRTGINSVVLGETTISRKSNVGGGSAKPFALTLPPR